MAMVTAVLLVHLQLVQVSRPLCFFLYWFDFLHVKNMEIIFSQNQWLKGVNRIFPLRNHTSWGHLSLQLRPNLLRKKARAVGRNAWDTPDFVAGKTYSAMV